MSARGRMRSLAEGVVGLGASDPGPYLDLIGPGESDAMRSAMLTMSGCGLTVRALWRLLGMSDPRLEAPYAIGQVMSQIQAMAREAGAWRDGASGLSGLGVGDVVYVSLPDHVGTVVSVGAGADGAVAFETVDGGSLDASGRQVIVRYHRAVSATGDVTAGPLAGSGRRLYGSVSLPAMCERFGGGGGFDLGDVAGLVILAGVYYFAWRVLGPRS